MTNLDWIRGLDLSFAADLFERGGPVVAIIALMSVAAFAVAFVKLGQFLYQGVGRGRGLEGALERWRKGDPSGATEHLRRRRSPAARALHHAIHNLAQGIDEALVREDVEQVAQRELAGLRSHLRVLEATSQVAPLLGLFGTVIGMMAAFQTLQAAGADADPAALAGGIWTALVTTAVGLAVAIPAGLALYWFEGRIDRETVLTEAALTRAFTQRPDLAARDAGHPSDSAYPHVSVTVDHYAAQ